MNKAIKWLLALVAVLLLAAVAAVTYITQVFDPNSLRPQIEAAAREQGVSIQLNGPLRWQWYPRLGLSVEDVTLRAGPSDLAQITLLSTQVAIAPLMQGRLAIAGIRVQGVSLNLLEDVDGRGNWQALSKDQAPASPAVNRSPAAAPATIDEPQPPHSSVDLAIDRLEIVDVTLRYHSKASQQQVQVAMPSCVIDQFNVGGEPFALDCRTLVQLDPYPQLQVHSRGQLRYNAETETLSLAPLQQTLGLNGETLNLTVQGSMRPQHNQLDLDVQLAPANLRAWLTGLGVALPGWPSLRHCSRCLWPAA